jgi:hypothetical protein
MTCVNATAAVLDDRRRGIARGMCTTNFVATTIPVLEGFQIDRIMYFIMF